MEQNSNKGEILKANLPVSTIFHNSGFWHY